MNHSITHLVYLLILVLEELGKFVNMSLMIVSFVVCRSLQDCGFCQLWAKVVIS